MSLELNKVAAAVLVAGLAAMAVGKVTDALYHPDADPEKRGYTIAGGEDAGGSASATPAGPVDILPFLAAGDPVKGAALAKACATCHTFEKGAPDGIGPNLWGAISRGVASHGAYAYSDALKGLGGSWDFQRLSEFLTKPAKYAPGTKMSFPGMAKPEDRASFLRYLNTMGDSALPIPAASPSAAPAAEAAPAAQPPADAQPKE